MWNRVALLCAGVAFGWSIVHWLTVPLAQVSGQRTRIWLSMAFAAVVLVLLALESPGAALAGGLVFALSAIVAYSAHAKQVASPKPPESSLYRPTTFAAPPANSDAQPDGTTQPSTPTIASTLVLVVAGGEPVAYQGPTGWAKRYRRHSAKGGSPVNWFTFPFLLARVRRAYGDMGDQNPYGQRFHSLASELGERLPPDYAVVTNRLDSEPLVEERLARPETSACHLLIVIPVELDDDDMATLRESITPSRLREKGLTIKYLPVASIASPGDPTAGERLALLARAQVPPPPHHTPCEITRQLAREIISA